MVVRTRYLDTVGRVLVLIRQLNPPTKLDIISPAAQMGDGRTFMRKLSAVLAI